ncbi:MAG: hypothetical protein ACI81T_001999, partial [Bacteroidia bacterium]
PILGNRLLIESLFAVNPILLNPRLNTDKVSPKLNVDG